VLQSNKFCLMALCLRSKRSHVRIVPGVPSSPYFSTPYRQSDSIHPDLTVCHIQAYGGLTADELRMSHPAQAQEAV
jgi:hypothetical protein